MEFLVILGLAAVGIFVIYKMMFKDEPLNTTSSLSTTAQSGSEASLPVINKNGSVTDNALDVNKDGKVDVKDAVEVVKKTRTRVKKSLDQDGDGKVTAKDVKAAVTKVKAKVKPKTTVPRGRKPAAKK